MFNNQSKSSDKFAETNWPHNAVPRKSFNAFHLLYRPWAWDELVNIGIVINAFFSVSFPFSLGEFLAQ